MKLISLTVNLAVLIYDVTLQGQTHPPQADPEYIYCISSVPILLKQIQLVARIVAMGIVAIVCNQL